MKNENSNRIFEGETKEKANMFSRIGEFFKKNFQFGFGKVRIRKLSGILVVSFAALAVLLSFINFVSQETHFPLVQNRRYRIQISEGLSHFALPAVKEFARSNPQIVIDEYGANNPDVVIDSKKTPGLENEEIELVPPLILEAGKKKIVGRKALHCWFSYKKGSAIFKIEDQLVEDLKESIENYYSKVSVRMNMVGDIIPGRHVAEKMAEHGVEYPFEKIAPYVRKADIVFGNLECPLTDSIKPEYEGMTFVAPSKTIDGLKLLGLNVAGVANNHSTNYGTAPFCETLELLKKNEIGYVGGGYDWSEAHNPLLIRKANLKIAFLQYNTIEGSIDAGDDKPGVAWVSMPPWRDENPEHFEVVANDIKRAKETADFVVVSFHWSKEDTYKPNESMKKMAHLCIESGADMVVGGHPHTVQPLGFFKGKFIAYSLGNFVFDQMQRDQTREGFFLKCEFKRNVLSKIEIVPYKIYDYCQPRVLAGKAKSRLIRKILSISGIKS
ncbi:MAG: CapA family protein [Actinomycetota bacterium]|nr:CapA family protein [Actinomycetota bacterium]